jgi:membrane protease YdiL (CAAX protease family)
LKTFIRIFILFIISQILAFGVLFLLSGLSINEIISLNESDPREFIDGFGIKNYMFLSQLFSILLPALIYLFIFHRENIGKWIKINLPKNKAFFLYGIMFLFLSYPLIQLSSDLNKLLPFSDFMTEESGLIEDLMKGVLKMDNVLDLLINIVMIALIPAIGEELFFRAGIQNEFVANIKNKDIAIIFTAIVFSAFHLQFDGFLPRFFLGLVLGYLYFWSNSIWLSVLIHFINNAMLVVTMYFMQDKLDTLDIEDSKSIPMHILLMSIIAVLVLRHKLIELSKGERNDIEIAEKNSLNE